MPGSGNDGRTLAHGGGVLVLVFTHQIYGYQGALIHRLLMNDLAANRDGIAVFDRPEELEVNRSGMVEDIRAEEFAQ